MNAMKLSGTVSARKRPVLSVWMALIPLVLILAAGCSKKPELETDPTGNGTQTTDTSDANRGDGSGNGNGMDGDTGGQDIRGDLEDVFFDLDRYALRPEARRVLDSNAELLKENAGWRVVLEGHCDERGTVEYNLALGEKRAMAAKDYLVRSGVEASRLRTLSYGEERPFDPGHNEGAWAQNRRVHFVRQ